MRDESVSRRPSSVQLLVLVGAVNGFLAVALGAFGAHALKARLSPAMLDVYKTGVQYHLAHALAIVLLASLADRIPVTLSAWLFLAGIVLFSGSLYLLAITGIVAFG